MLKKTLSVLILCILTISINSSATAQQDFKTLDQKIQATGQTASELDYVP